MASDLTTNDVIVIYDDVLFCAPDPAGLSNWITEIDSGESTLQQAISAFVNSQEAQTVVDPIIRLYIGLFDRAPDLSGLAFWIGQEDAGASLDTIAQDFVSSPEFYNDYGADTLANPTAFIEALYERVLGRPADPGGLAAWLAVLGSSPTVASEADVVIGLINSAEFVSDLGASPSTWLTNAVNSALETTSATAIGAITQIGLMGEGAILTEGSGGSLVNSAGTWTFGTETESSGGEILLNGQQAANGWGIELVIDNGGQLYAENATGNWYEWVDSTWSVATDPLGGTSSGLSSSSTAPNAAAPNTTSASLTIVGNGAATAIGIPAPTDPNYPASQLTVIVTALPTDGSVLLSNGTTAVTVGESLTVAQLTGLEFQPTSGSFNQNSTLSYTVTDPSGLSANGNATLAIVADTASPVANDVTLGVAENSAATAIGIPAPTDANYAASQLTVTVEALPTDGTVLLSDGATSVTVGETLTVAQLTGLEFEPTSGAAGETSTLTYTVTDPAGLSATGTDTLTINGSGGSGTSPSAPANNGPAGTIDSTPTIIQPSQAGDIVGAQLQNTGSTAESSGYVTFGEVFKDGAVSPTESLVARIDGVDYAVQMNVETTNTDGSVSMAVLTLDAPAIPANGTISLMLANAADAVPNTPTVTPSTTAPSAAQLLTNLENNASDNVTVNFTFNNANGTTTTDSTNAAAALQQALANGTVQDWLSGPQLNEYIVTTTVDGGDLKVEFDIKAYANGTTTTDVIFDNSWMNSPGKTDLNYNVSINQGSQTVYSANDVQQYLYSLWQYQVASPGTISPNVQYDIGYLESTGAIQAYDTSVGVAASTIATYAASLDAANTGPLGTADVTTYMPTTGGRDDIGPQPAWVTEWLLSQNATAEQTMMANAEAAGGIPWHFTDESTGEPLNPIAYSNFWDDSRGAQYGYVEPANGLPEYSAGGGLVSADGDPWTPDAAHQPDLNYIPYLITGSYYQLENLQAQADYDLFSGNPGYDNALIPGSTIEYGLINTSLQTRAIAWDIRELAEAAFITPNSDPLKAAFTTEIQDTMASMVQQYITDGADSVNGQIQGFIQGANSPSVSPWQQGYIVTSLADVAGMNIPQASADAIEMLQYMNNFISGLFTNAAAGFNPIEGSAYWLNTTDPTTGAPYTTWAEFYQGNLASGNIPTPTGVLPNLPLDTQGGYAEIAMAALADEITYTASPQAIQAYGYVVSQIAYAFAQAGSNEAAAFAGNPEWDIMPKLPDGVYLTSSQMQIDTSASNNVSLTAQGGDSLLSVIGSGTDTLTGGTDTCDLLYGGTGTDTLVAGTGNDYLFGGTGTNTFIDGPGNNYMSSNGTANTYIFNIAKSGSDTIANFNVNTDQIQIASNLNGDGITSVSELLAAATVSNGSTVLHLGPHDAITFLGIATPATLAHDIVIT